MDQHKIPQSYRSPASKIPPQNTNHFSAECILQAAQVIGNWSSIHSDDISARLGGFVCSMNAALQFRFLTIKLHQFRQIEFSNSCVTKCKYHRIDENRILFLLLFTSISLTSLSDCYHQQIIDILWEIVLQLHLYRD